jgi:hypothetical protein
MFWLRKYSRAGERQAARSAHTQRQDQEGLSAGASRKDKQRRATIGANLRRRRQRAKTGRRVTAPTVAVRAPTMEGYALG